MWGRRGFRPRHDQKFSWLFAVVLGVGSGYYIFHEDLKKNKQVADKPKEVKK